MKNIPLSLLLFLTVSISSAYAQFNGVQINLEKKSMVIGESKRVSVFSDMKSNRYFVGNKESPKIDNSNPDTWFKRDADTLFEISKIDFDRVSELCIGFSSINLCGGMKTNDYIISTEPKLLELEIIIGGQSICYTLFLPFDKNNEHLKQMEDLCETILLLAGEDVDAFLERKEKKWYNK